MLQFFNFGGYIMKIFSIVTLLFLSFSLFAQQPPPQMPNPMERFDKDKNGSLDNGELSAMVDFRNKKQEEGYKKWLKNRPSADEIFKKLDVNGDNKITPDEFFGSQRGRKGQKFRPKFRKQQKQ
jgi:hypothetical protein